MATVTFPQPVSLFRQLVNAYIAWRWQRKRHVCESCAACGPQLEDDAAQLLNSGHHRAAVFMARLHLEVTIAELHGHYDGRVCTSELAYRLVDKGVIKKPTANRVSNLYGQASRVVHGRACPRARAVGLVRNMRLLRRELLTEQQHYAAGTTEGGAR